MGTIHHDFVIAVSDWDQDKAIAAFDRTKQYAKTVGGDFGPTPFERLLVGPINGVANGTATFFMAPDGSKEGWETSTGGDQVREYFIEAMQEARCVVVFGSFGELRTQFHAGDTHLVANDGW